jgi:1-acyl-sn-glycerol-3-phosphate acyltransferase
MQKILLTPVNTIYILYLAILSILFELSMPFYYLYFKLRKKGHRDDFFRIHNWMYGRMLVRWSWPYIRSQVKGAENIPEKGPYVIVLNHRSFLDIFFSALVPVPNQLVVVRNWVFHLVLFGWAMRLARYPNIDQTPLNKLREISKEFSDRDVSFQFYPEGHRSRDGKLRRFRTGAFMIAADNNLPVIPVCMIGTNDFGSYHFPYFRPAKITLEILKPVWPGDFPEELRALKLRKYVEKMFREYFGE